MTAEDIFEKQGMGESITSFYIAYILL